MEARADCRGGYAAPALTQIIGHLPSVRELRLVVEPGGFPTRQERADLDAAVEAHPQLAAYELVEQPSSG